MQIAVTEEGCRKPVPEVWDPFGPTAMNFMFQISTCLVHSTSLFSPSYSNMLHQLHVIVMPTFFQALDRKTTLLNQKQISDLAFISFFTI